MLDSIMKRISKKSTKAVKAPPPSGPAEQEVMQVLSDIKTMIKPKAPQTRGVSAKSEIKAADELLNRLIAGSGLNGRGAPSRKGSVLGIQDILSRGYNTPFLPEGG